MVTYPKGFKASGYACGLKKKDNLDLAIVVSDKPCIGAGVYTSNLVKGHSLQLTLERMNRKGPIKGLIINSGCANACIGKKGYEDALDITGHLAEKLREDKESILFGSTGVIGQPLNIEAIKKGIDKSMDLLSYEGGLDAVRAIMTTDTFPKTLQKDIIIDGYDVRLGAMAKGSGMIHPNMATMIAVITSDINIGHNLLERAFKRVNEKTFNRLSVDGDTSVCDMALILANGEANNPLIDEEGADYRIFEEALYDLCEGLVRMLAKDGEGATKLIEVSVTNALTQKDAHLIANAISTSPLCKTAFFGQDANWGRIITAAGYSGAYFDPEKVHIYLGDLLVCKDGAYVDFDEDKALDILKRDEVKVLINLNIGLEKTSMWTCDLSYDYVKINGSYRS